MAAHGGPGGDRWGWESFKIATTFVGTVVGAGFASGQETMRFFAAFGQEGTWGIVVATLGFACFGIAAMDLGRCLGTQSYRRVLDFGLGGALGSLVDLVVALFLFVSVAVMFSGSGAVVQELGGYDPAVGVTAIAVTAVLTVLLRLRGITLANGLIVPVMVAMLVGLALAGITAPAGPAPRGWHASVPWPGAAAHWLLSALLYVAYNLLLSVAVLVPLGRSAHHPRAIIWGGVVGALTLGLLTLAIKTSMLAHLPEVAGTQVPILYLAAQRLPRLRPGYALVLWLEMYSTAISSLYGLALRSTERWRVDYPVAVLLAAGAALWAGGLGFAPLVATFYPLFGYLSLVLLLGLGRGAFRSWRGGNQGGCRP